MTGSITLRPVTANDESFLYNLYKLSRIEEFSSVPLTEAQFDALMQMQYLARKSSYEMQFPGAEHSIVCVDGTAAGHIWVYRNNSHHRIVDIALLQTYQNRGVGTSLLGELIAQARRDGVSLTCSVATNNPGSLRFHERLGFHVMDQNDMYYELALRPESAPRS